MDDNEDGYLAYARNAAQVAADLAAAAMSAIDLPIFVPAPDLFDDWKVL